MTDLISPFADSPDRLLFLIKTGLTGFSGIYNLFSFVMFAVISLPIFILAADVCFLVKKKMFYKIVALQASQLAVLISYIGLSFYAYILYEKLSSLALVSPASHYIMCEIFPSIAFVCLILSLLFRTPRIKSILPGMVCTFAGFLLYLMSSPWLLGNRNTLTEEVFSFDLVRAGVVELFGYFMITSENSTFLPDVIRSVLYGIVLASILCMLWLFFRRKKADYGRDYYFFAMQYCAKTAFVTSIGFLILFSGALLVMEGVNTFSANPLLLATFYLPFVVSCMLLFRILSSATPMRHKLSVFCCLVLLFFCLVLNMGMRFVQVV